MTEKPCTECINYLRCQDKDWRACRLTVRGDDRAEYWNKEIFVDDLMQYVGLSIEGE